MNTSTYAYPASRMKTRAHSEVSSGSNFGVTVMIAGLLLCAFCVVYLKDLNRRLFIENQGLVQVQRQYEVEWGKLLLEQSTWSTQSRIQSIASRKLGMVMPKAKDIVMVEANKS